MILKKDQLTFVIPDFHDILYILIELPNEVIHSLTRLLSPLITEEMAMTVVTPMTIPRMVNPERSLFVFSVSRASRTDSRVWPRAIEPSSAF